MKRRLDTTLCFAEILALSGEIEGGGILGELPAAAAGELPAAAAV